MRFTTNALFGLSSLTLVSAHGFLNPPEPEFTPERRDLGVPVERREPSPQAVETREEAAVTQTQRFVILATPAAVAAREVDDEAIVVVRSPQIPGGGLTPPSQQQQPSNPGFCGSSFCRRQLESGPVRPVVTPSRPNGPSIIINARSPQDSETVRVVPQPPSFCGSSFCRRSPQFFRDGRPVQPEPANPGFTVDFKREVAPRSPQTAGRDRGLPEPAPAPSFCGSSFCRRSPRPQSNKRLSFFERRQ